MLLRQKIVCHNPRVTAGDILYLGAMLAIAVIFGYFGVNGLLSWFHDTRRAIISIPISRCCVSCSICFCCDCFIPCLRVHNA